MVGGCLRSGDRDSCASMNTGEPPIVLGRLTVYKFVGWHWHDQGHEINHSLLLAIRDAETVFLGS
jgi:hypothetical protein